MAEKSNYKISVVCICKDEANHIIDFIESCKQISDDVVIIDSGSQDNTVNLAKSAGAHVYEQAWLGYGPQKNFGNSKAKHDWVLSLDADERISGLMLQSLKNLKAKEKTCYAWKLVDHINDTPIKYGELKPSWKKRLFNKKDISWDKRMVHEQLILPKGYKVERLKGKILHYSYENIKDFQEKIIFYAELGAKHMISDRKFPSLIKRIINPSFRFVRSYLLFGGFLDFKYGYQISKILKQGLEHKYRLVNKDK